MTNTIKLSTFDVTSIKIGTSNVDAVYVGAEKVYPSSTPPHDYSQDYLTFVATESGTFKFSGNSINYSIDSGATWTSLASNTSTPTISAGNTIMWKGTLTPSTRGIGSFSATNTFVVQGNTMSLLYGDNFSGQTSLPDKAFMYMFSGCTNMESTENIVLPATTMSASGYAYMFDTCSSITKLPNLPATTLAPHCYRTMFARCSSVASIPNDYLPVTTLKEACYINMFYSCTSLTASPLLPATTLVKQCYQGLFYNCSRLNTITCLATSISASNCTAQWVSSVASSGTFIKAANMSSWGSCGANKIPCNWTVQNYS